MPVVKSDSIFISTMPLGFLSVIESSQRLSVIWVPASEWLQDSVKRLWRAFIVGLRVVAGSISQALPNSDSKEFS